LIIGIRQSVGATPNDIRLQFLIEAVTLSSIGGLVGIGGIVVGRRVRNEIDASPGRYTGRSQAVGGIVTGIIGVSIFTLVTVLIVLAVIAGIASADF
jgi:putative ABC transport system permease protein